MRTVFGYTTINKIRAAFGGRDACSFCLLEMADTSEVKNGIC